MAGSSSLHCAAGMVDSQSRRQTPERGIRMYIDVIKDLGWRRTPGEDGAPPACDFCADPVNAELDEIAANGAKATFLCQCSKCGRYWGGFGFAMDTRWELSLEEAA